MNLHYSPTYKELQFFSGYVGLYFFGFQFQVMIRFWKIKVYHFRIWEKRASAIPGELINPTKLSLFGTFQFHRILFPKQYDVGAKYGYHSHGIRFDKQGNLSSQHGT